MQAVKLNNGQAIPALGLGTWQAPPNLVGDAVEYALTKAGYTHIDCASIYKNEKEIGEAFKKSFATVKREDIFITSKLWNTNHAPEDAEKALKKTLSDLQLEYLDLYLIHWGIAFKNDNDPEPLDENGMIKTARVTTQETWETMENFVKKGLVKSIGVANFTSAMLVDLLAGAKIKPAMNQIELHPYLTQEKLITYCQYQEIAVTAYSPLGRPNVEKAQHLLQEKIITNLSEKYKKTPAQVILNWAITRGTIAIPKSTHPARIDENIAVFDFNLTDEEVKQISSLNKNLRIVDPIDWWGIPYFA